jgi:hypothetical protein
LSLISIGRWVPSQKCIALLYPEWQERVLPAGKTSSDAINLLERKPALIFVLSERVNDRKSLCMVAFHLSGAAVKLLIDRDALGFVLDTNEKHFGTLSQLVDKVFGRVTKAKTRQSEQARFAEGRSFQSEQILN